MEKIEHSPEFQSQLRKNGNRFLIIGLYITLSILVLTIVLLVSVKYPSFEIIKGTIGKVKILQSEYNLQNLDSGAQTLILHFPEISSRIRNLNNDRILIESMEGKKIGFFCTDELNLNVSNKNMNYLVISRFQVFEKIESDSIIRIQCKLITKKNRLASILFYRMNSRIKENSYE